MIKNLYFISPVFSVPAMYASKTPGHRGRLNDSDAYAAYCEKEIYEHHHLTGFDIGDSDTAFGGGWMVLMDMELMKNDASAMNEGIN
jgi:hypothetical protein